MSSYKFIQIIVEHGYKVEEYENHYSVCSRGSVIVVVTIPKVTYLAKTVVDSIKKLLRL